MKIRSLGVLGVGAGLSLGGVGMELAHTHGAFAVLGAGLSILTGHSSVQSAKAREANIDTNQRVAQTRKEMHELRNGGMKAAIHSALDERDERPVVDPLGP